MAAIGQFEGHWWAFASRQGRVRNLLTNTAHGPHAGGCLSRCFRSTIRAGVDREVLMTHEFNVLAPESPAPSLAPNQIVPLLIGSTVGEIERELVLQTLARCDGNRTRASRVLGVSVRTLRNKIRQYSAEGIDVPAHSD